LRSTALSMLGFSNVIKNFSTSRNAYLPDKGACLRRDDVDPCALLEREMCSYLE
jgi:hypothetical protein